MPRQSKNDESGGVVVLKSDSHRQPTENNNWYQMNSNFESKEISLSSMGFLAESMRQDGFMNDFDLQIIHEANEFDCLESVSNKSNSNHSCGNQSTNRHTYNCPCCGLDFNLSLSAYHSHVTQCYSTRVLAYKKQDESEKALEEEELQRKKCRHGSKSSRNSNSELRSSSISSSNNIDGNLKAKTSVHSTASTTVSEPATVTLEQLKSRVAQLGTEQRIELMKAFKQLSKEAQEESYSPEASKYSTEKVLSLLYSPAPSKTPNLAGMNLNQNMEEDDDDDDDNQQWELQNMERTQQNTINETRFANFQRHNTFDEFVPHSPLFSNSGQNLFGSHIIAHSAIETQLSSSRQRSITENGKPLDCLSEFSLEARRQTFGDRLEM